MLRTLLILACLSLGALFLYAEESAWEEAIAPLKSSQFEEASEKLGTWIKEKASKGIYSSEAHYNLFLAQIGLESSGPAVAHLLRSIQLEKNPFKNIEAIETLCELQSRYGIKEGPCQSHSFTLSLLAGSNFLVVLLCLFLWGAFSSLLFYVKNKKNLFRFSLVATLILSGAHLFFTLQLGTGFPVMVLSGKEKTVAIYKTEENVGENKLVDLAEGTLVGITGEVKNGRRHLTEPVAGWVKEDELIKVDESLSHAPTFAIHSQKPDST